MRLLLYLEILLNVHLRGNVEININFDDRIEISKLVIIFLVDGVEQHGELALVEVEFADQIG